MNERLAIIVDPKGDIAVIDIRERIAQEIYELDPYWDGGEAIDGFQVTPAGALSWRQAKDTEAELPEFSGDKVQWAYRAADVALRITGAKVC